MHNFTVNASIQLLPLAQDRHPYQWVDEAISIIQQSSLIYEVGAFATTIEGSYTEVMQLINKINEHLLEKGCEEWITNIQVQIRGKGDITGNEKTAKYQAGF